MGLITKDLCPFLVVPNVTERQWNMSKSKARPKGAKFKILVFSLSGAIRGSGMVDMK